MTGLQSSSANSMAPAVLRVVENRLLSWLPPGRVTVSANAPDLKRGLRAAGVEVVESGESVASVLVVEDGREDAEAALLSQIVQPTGDHLCLVITGDMLDQSRRVFWERAMQRAEWRKHPRTEAVAPYGELDRVAGVLVLAFEPVRATALERYPLEVLESERDLHTDMTREAGRRSDAHMARYAQASQFIRDGDRVIDVACGLGYGTAQLARNSRPSSLIGLDASEYAVDYANTNFSDVASVALNFRVGDAQKLDDMADGSADFAVSVETLEHLPQPELLLAELARILVSGGLLYASVPNDWSDETGEDPNPFHFHVYDWQRLVDQFRRSGFVIEKAWLQDAGGGQKRHLSTRSMLEFDPQSGPTTDGEWLLVLARRSEEDATNVEDPLRIAKEQLASGSRSEAMLLLDSLTQDRSHAHPLLPCIAHATLAVIHARAGDATTAADAWLQCAERGRPMLEERGLRSAASALIALSYDAMQDESRPLADLLANHQAAARMLAIDVPGSVLDELSDRAVVHGLSTESCGVNLTHEQIRQTMEAKSWLDAKYKEHVMKITEMELYVSELEHARHWLDGQYHSLTDQVRQLRLAGSA